MAYQGENELAEAHKALAWLFLVGLLLISSAARGVYSSQGVAPSARFELLERIGLLSFIWFWVRAQCRPYRVAFPMDLGLFLAGLWIFILPHYLWRCERWRGHLKCAAIAGAYVVAYLLSIAIHYALVSGGG